MVTAFSFNAASVDAGRVRLVQKGMKFTTRPQTVGMAVSMVYCYDPDGNCIELIETLDPEWPLPPRQAASARAPGDDVEISSG